MMLKLTKLHWMNGKVDEEPIYIDGSTIIWMQRTTFREQPATAVVLPGYNFHVVQTPEQIVRWIEGSRGSIYFAALKELIKSHDDNTGAEPSVSVFERNVDYFRNLVMEGL